jgi:hypothetical protein
MATSNPTHPVLTAFGLEGQEAALARALRATGATIHGGAALSWYTSTAPPSGQDIDIWCRPVEPILYPLVIALYDTIFRAAGYTPSGDSVYTDSRREHCYNAEFHHIAHIMNWHNPTMRRQIQLILRKPGAPAAINHFDLDICQIGIIPTPGAEGLVAIPPASLSPVQLGNKVMRVVHLTGQSSKKFLYRVRKYYERGFAFETSEAHCSCPCGAASHRTVTPPRRMTLEEGLEYAEKEWVKANPLPSHRPHRADNLQRYLQRSDHRLADKSLQALEQEHRSCELAITLLQNKHELPLETAWIRKYMEVLNNAARVKRLVQEWEEAAAPQTRMRCEYTMNYCKHYEAQATVQNYPALLRILTNLRGRAQQRLRELPPVPAQGTPTPTQATTGTPIPYLSVTDVKNGVPGAGAGAGAGAGGPVGACAGNGAGAGPVGAGAGAGTGGSKPYLSVEEVEDEEEEDHLLHTFVAINKKKVVLKKKPFF